MPGYILKTEMKTEPNKALEGTRLLVTDRAPSSTLRAKQPCPSAWALGRNTIMAWIIAFSKKIPPGIPPREHHHYTISSRVLDYSNVGETKKPNDEDVNRVIKEFEKDNHVTNWREIADHIRFAEEDYH